MGILNHDECNGISSILSRTKKKTRTKPTGKCLLNQTIINITIWPISIEMMNYYYCYSYYDTVLYVFRSRNLVDGKFRFVSTANAKKNKIIKFAWLNIFDVVIIVCPLLSLCLTPSYCIIINTFSETETIELSAPLLSILHSCCSLPFSFRFSMVIDFSSFLFFVHFSKTFPGLLTHPSEKIWEL